MRSLERILFLSMMLAGLLGGLPTQPSPAVAAAAQQAGNQVPWGTTADGMAIKVYIKAYEDEFSGPNPQIWRPLTAGRNIAVFAYTETDSGPVRRIVVANAPREVVNRSSENVVIMELDEDYEIIGKTYRNDVDDIHSEALLDEWLAEKEISSNRVLSGESERQECENRCSIFLGSSPESRHGSYALLNKNGGLKYNYASTDKNVDYNLEKDRQSWRDAGRPIVKPKSAAAKSHAMLGLKCGKESAMGGPGVGTGQAGGRIVAMAALPMAAPCGDSSSAVAKALGSNDYGGVDFSTLELRYMSDPGSGGVRYSFSGRQDSHGGGQNLESGLGTLTNSTADLRTWLVLNPNKFWVNLNPSEPDRIVDPALGETNAGRALLEADLQMKRTEGKLLNPDTDLGARYWKAMAGSSEKHCYASRLWIVPGDVQVREDGSSLYILKATLAVKAKAEHLESVGGSSCTSDPESDARNERLEQTMVVPKIVEMVNTTPEYAPIRQAFMARIVAEWIRSRHQQGHQTSFDDLIDSGDLGPAELQDGWKPKQVFDSYVDSIRSGEFTYKQTVREGRTVVRRTMTFGGVDFSNMPMSRTSAAQTKQQYPWLPQTVKASADHPASASDGSIWLGDTAGSADNGLWSRTTGTISAVVSSRIGLLVLLLVALGVITFGIRGPRRKRRAS